MKRFQVIKTKGGLRQGKISTPHGVLKTPFFMPDATRGYLKLLSLSDLEKIDLGPMVVNTYHLFLSPKMDIIKRARGIHNFIGWNRPLLSDSGGFQVFSLIHRNPKMGKITDEKVIFKSPLDGSWHEITPEKSIQIQFELGVDMMVCLDDCPPNSYTTEKIKAAVGRTISWAKRCKREYEKQVKKRKMTEANRPLLFSVIQGGNDKELRRYCAEELVKIGFDGYGFGAMPVDEEGNFRADILAYTASVIPEKALRFALGIGTPADILKCASLGWDMFDCVIPTREGRHGRLFLQKGRVPNQGGISSKNFQTINITNAKFSRDFSPVNPQSRQEELKKYSKAFLHHLFKMNEGLGQRLASLNNLEFYMELLKFLRLK